MLLKLAGRNITRHSTRSLITLSAIVFGCISIILVDAFFNNLFVRMRESYTRQHTGHIQIYKHGYAEKGAAHPFDYLIDRPEEIMGMIRQIDGIQYVSSRLQFAGLISTGDSTAPALTLSIEPEVEVMQKEDPNKALSASDEKLGSGTLIDGETVKPGEDYSVLMGTGLATNVGVKPGAGLILVANTVSGSINALDVTLQGTFRTSAKEFDDRVLRVPLKTAQKLLQTDSVQSLLIVLKNTDDTDRVIGEIHKIFDEHHLDYEVKHWKDLNDFYLKTRLLFGRFFMILIVVVVIVVVLSIFNTMNMAVLERTNEIGTLRAIGERRSQIVALFLCEGLLLGIIGGIIGALAGAAVTVGVAAIGIPMPPPPGATMYWLSEPELSSSAIMTAIIVSIVTSIVSSMYPARKASRLEIAEALRHVS